MESKIHAAITFNLSFMEGFRFIDFSVQLLAITAQRLDNDMKGADSRYLAAAFTVSIVFSVSHKSLAIIR